MMNLQEQAWAGNFGDEYLKRNRVDWRLRTPFWKTILDITGARSVCELGTNAGWNLSAIRRAYPDVEVCGTDVNEQAVHQARQCGFDVYFSSGIYNPHRFNSFDLVFTSGVLIHIPPSDLYAKMRSIVDKSCSYVLAVEYFSEEEEEISYRGEKGLLWKRPYGKLYEVMGLEQVATGFLTKEDGFDSCTYWLMEKP